MQLHVKGSQRGHWNLGRWWTNFFTIYNTSGGKCLQNGFLMGWNYKKYGNDVFNIRVESGELDRNGFAYSPRHLIKEIKLNWRRRL